MFLKLIYSSDVVIGYDPGSTVHIRVFHCLSNSEPVKEMLTKMLMSISRMRKISTEKNLEQEDKGVCWINTSKILGKQQDFKKPSFNLTFPCFAFTDPIYSCFGIYSLYLGYLRVTYSSPAQGGL